MKSNQNYTRVFFLKNNVLFIIILFIPLKFSSSIIIGYENLYFFTHSPVPVYLLFSGFFEIYPLYILSIAFLLVLLTFILGYSGRITSTNTTNTLGWVNQQQFKARQLNRLPAFYNTTNNDF